MNNKSVLKKYETIVSNIEWHIKTNEPPEEELEKLNARLDIYREVIHDFSDELPSLPNSTESLSKIADKDEWLNEVRGNEGLIEKFNSEIINISPQLKDVFVRDGGINPLSKRIATKCVQIAKQYSDSKLSELEKWIDTYTEFFEFSSSQLKDKIKSLKQQS